ncbi:ATP-dependent nuclease [Sorangium cellulosum]|uniref:ATP-dependent nuclease n=1 Tax=Sorangium cellulosum TaxID=56 RepID=UPI0012FF5CCB|nr:AAA family ATPase [Sorangium cellulosum]
MNTHKGLQSRRFSGLGHINVICGRNNSGKSTVLEAIVKSGVGRATDPEPLIDMARNLAHKDKRNGIDPQLWSIIEPAILDAMRSIHTNRTNVFSEEGIRNAITSIVEVSSNLVEQYIETDKMDARLALALKSRAMYLDSALHSAFAKVYRSSFNAVLMPARRQIEPQSNLDSSDSGDTLEPNGEGLVQHLFACRNKRKSSPERHFYDSVRQHFREISSGFDFDLSMSDGGLISIDFFSEEGAHPADKCGLGLHELLVIISFTLWGTKSAVCIEEPENHMHPEMQRRLLSFFRHVTTRQFFISTHSNVFVNSAAVDKVFFTSYKDAAVHVDDVTSRATALHDLGYSVTDNLVSDLVILVEGPTDVPIVEEFLEKLGIGERYTIKIWPLGGDIMDQLDLSVFGEKYKSIALVDLDPGSGGVRKRFAEACSNLNIELFRLHRYAIENYFTLDSLRSVLGNQIPCSVTTIATDKPLKDQIGINVKKNNRKIARAMSFDDISNTDLGAFFRRVEQMVKGQ